MNKPVKVHRLPTEDKTNIQQFGISLRGKNNQVDSRLGYYQHLYFTSDEKPKEGDWCLHKVFGLGNIQLLHGEECFVSKKRDANDGSITTPWKKNIPNIRKIVATTDKSLTIIKDITNTTSTSYDNSKVSKVTTTRLLPQISQQFIEKYVKAGGEIDEVWLELEHDDTVPFPKTRIKTDQNNYVIIHSVEQIQINLSSNEFVSIQKWLDSQTREDWNGNEHVYDSLLSKFKI